MLRRTTNDAGDDLRKRAEDVLRRGATGLPAPTPQELQQIVHELEVHQIELRMQNEALRDAQQELDTSRNRYADLYDFAPVGYLTLDSDGAIRQINLAAARLLGRERARLVGRHLAQYAAEDGRGRLYAHLRACAEGPSTASCEVWLCRKDGPPVPVKLDTLRVEKDGRTQYRMTMTDIGERVRAEAALREARDELERRMAERTAELRQGEERYRALAEGTHDVPYRLDAQGKVLYLAPQAERYGIDPAEAVARHFSELVVPEERDRLVREFAEALRTGQTRPLEFRHRDAEGRVWWLEERGTVQRDAAGAPLGVTGVLRDVTERKALEKAMSKLAVQERRKIGQELHDELGQELTGLGYLTACLLRQLERNDPRAVGTAAELAGGIQHAIDAAGRLSQGLIPVEVDHAGLTAALEQLAAGFESRYGTACHFRADPSAAVADDHVAAQLYRIAQEALLNVFKHARAQQVEIELNGGPDAVALVVRDDGCGLPADVAQAAGLGLRIMRYRAGVIGADFEARSAEGRGTEIRCTLSRREKP